jgi:hypothetical protein
LRWSWPRPGAEKGKYQTERAASRCAAQYDTLTASFLSKNVKIVHPNAALCHPQLTQKSPFH